MFIMHHNDPDGWVSAQLVKELHPDAQTKNVVFWEMEYGKPTPLDKIAPHQDVFILDFSISPQDMKGLRNRVSGTIVWIDHHQTAIDKYRDYQHKTADHPDFIGLQASGTAACALTLMWLLEHRKALGLSLDVPPFLKAAAKYVSDMDVWAFRHGDDTRNFVAGFCSYPMKPGETHWETFEKESGYSINQLIHDGTVIRRAKKQSDQQYAAQYGFDAELDGHKVFAVNHGFVNRDTFFPAWKTLFGYGLLAGFTWDGKQYKFSLRSLDDSVDAAAIAQKYGGGGHKGAAGFTCAAMPLKPLNEKEAE